MNSASNVVVLLSLESAAKTQSPLRSHATSLAIENLIAWETAVSFAVAVLLLLLIICDIIAELFIAALFVSAIVGISILFILPVNKKNDPFIWDGSVGIPVPLLDMSISWENAVGKNETQEFTADPIVNSKVKAIVTGLPRSISNLFLEFPTDDNKELVANFLDSSIKQENISLNTKRIYLIALAYLAREVKKPLQLVTNSDFDIYRGLNGQVESRWITRN